MDRRRAVTLLQFLTQLVAMLILSGALTFAIIAPAFHLWDRWTR